MPRRFSFWLSPLFLVLLFLALIFSLSASPLRAQSSTRTLSLAEYRAELATAITQLEAIPAADAEPVVAELQERFATMNRVELPSGDPVEITSLLQDLPTPTDEALSVDGPSVDDPTVVATAQDLALARLRGALAQIDATTEDNTTARLAILAEVLARPEFNAPVSLRDRFWQWLENLFRDLLPESQSMTGATWLNLLVRLLPWIITILMLAVVIWLLSYWLQRFLRSFVADVHTHPLAGDDDLPRTAAEARQQAQVAAQSGLYRDAVRRLYLAALLQLAEHHLIPYERSLTNHEVLVRVPNDSPIRPHLEPVIATFDQVWYGVREPDQATFAAYEQEIDTLATVAQQAAAQAHHAADAPAIRGEA